MKITTLFALGAMLISSSAYAGREVRPAMMSGKGMNVENVDTRPCGSLSKCRSSGALLDTKASFDTNSYKPSKYPKVGYKLSSDGLYYKKGISK